MRIEERVVSPALRPWISKLWAFEGEFEFALERVLPSGLVEVLINLDEAETRTYPDGAGSVRRHAAVVVQGPRAAPVVIDTHEQRRVIGIVFQPGGAQALLGVPASALVERHVDLRTLWPEHAGLRDRLLASAPTEWLAVVEQALAARLGRAVLPDAAVVCAARSLDGGESLQRVQARVGMGRKRFNRLFAAAVGFTPKRFAGIRRFRRVLDLVNARGLEAPDWAGLAFECGYFDQSHLIADFRRFAGMTPTRYRPREQAASHVPL